MAQIMRHGVGTGVVGIVLAIGLVVLQIALIARWRQNWARWLFAALSIVGLPQYLWGILQAWQVSPPAAVLQMISTVLSLLGLWFVFTGDANEWFKRDNGAA